MLHEAGYPNKVNLIDLNSSVQKNVQLRVYERLSGFSISFEFNVKKGTELLRVPYNKKFSDFNQGASGRFLLWGRQAATKMFQNQIFSIAFRYATNHFCESFY